MNKVNKEKKSDIFLTGIFMYLIFIFLIGLILILHENEFKKLCGEVGGDYKEEKDVCHFDLCKSLYDERHNACHGYNKNVFYNDRHDKKMLKGVLEGQKMAEKFNNLNSK